MAVSYDTRRIKKRGDQLPTFDEIQLFLMEMRSLIDQGRFVPVNRSKNIQTLLSLGITWEDAKLEIRELEQGDYVSGPEEDKDFPGSGSVWVFYKEILGQLIYIKLKIEIVDPNVKALSFHFEGMHDGI